MITERRTAFVSTPFFRAILGFCLFFVVALFWFRLNPKPESYEQKRAAVRLKLLQDLRLEDGRKLNNYSWVDEKKGIVQIPVERAEEILMDELKTKTAQPTSVKVENPYPAGLQSAPAPVPSPTPSASPKKISYFNQTQLQRVILGRGWIASFQARWAPDERSASSKSGQPSAMSSQCTQRHFLNSGIVPRVCFWHRAWNARSTICLHAAQNEMLGREVFVQKFRI